MDRLERLQIFLSICSEGSLISAAQRTGRSAAAITRALRELESEMNVRLLQRTTRRMALTEAGRRLLPLARRLLADYEEAAQQIGVESVDLRGRIVVSAPLVFGHRHLAPLVVAFLAQYPKLEIELSLSDRMHDLLEDEIDVALRIATLRDSTMMIRPLGHVRRVLVASPDYLRRKGTPKSPQNLKGHEMILFQGQAAGEGPWRSLARGRAAPSLAGRLIVNSAEAGIAAALAGQGLFSTLSYQVQSEVKAGHLIRLLRPFEPPSIPVQLIYPAGRFLPLRIRHFIDFVARQLKKRPELKG